MTLPTAHRGTLQPGDKLDRYELLCPLAEGGMASVWLARFTGKFGFEKLVAIKTILAEYADHATFRQMFLNEAAMAARIEHPNVARVIDLGEVNGLLFLVMEWVDGASLSLLERIVHAAGQLIPMEIALRIVADACEGLHAAHEARDDSGRPLGLVHRDVSPQNIMLSMRGVAKLIDFGVATS